MQQISQDPGMMEIVQIAENLRGKYSSHDLEWAGSPFAWIKALPSRTVGKVGEELVEHWCAAQNFDVSPSPNSEADRVIDGLRVEIKLSTLWKTGTYKFQQLRDQAYDVVICLGISPRDVHCWVLPKALIVEKWASGEISAQHTGSAGRDTAWFTVNPNAPQPWLTPRSGKLTAAAQQLRQLTENANKE